MATNNDPYDIVGTGEAIGGAIAQIGTIFKDRFARKQYDDFLAGPSKDYQAAMTQAQDLMLDQDNADAPQQAIHIIKNATTEFMDNATRYKGNPYIMEKATRVWEGHMSFIKDEFTGRFDAAKEERSRSASERNAELQPLRKQNLEADIAKKKAEAGKAERWQSKGNAEALKGAPQFLSGNPEELSKISDSGERASTARQNIMANINTPRDERQRDQINLGIKSEARSMAQQLVSERSARGEVRPKWTDEDGQSHSAEPWDVSNREHIEAAMGMIDPALPKERFIINTLNGESRATGVDSKIVDDKFGALVDPSRATPKNPVTRTVSEEELNKVLFGGRGVTQDNARMIPVMKNGKPVLDNNGEPVMRNATNYGEKFNADKLPETYDKLSGILGESTNGAIQVLNVMKQEGKPITLEYVKEMLKDAGFQTVALYLGGDVDIRDLPPGIQQNRRDAEVAINAVSNKYAEQIAESLGLEFGEKKAPAKEEDTDSSFSIGNDFIKNYTPFGTFGSRIDQAKGLLKDKEKKK